MRFAGAIFVAFVCVSAPALGAGYEVKEHSADAMAAAYAGAAATGSDASYLAYNPAAAAYVANTDFSFSVVEILPGSNGTYGSAKTSAGNATGGSLDPRGFISDATVPALAFRQRLSDRWTFGLSITSPWGLRTDYPENWTGRYYALKTELFDSQRDTCSLIPIDTGVGDRGRTAGRICARHTDKRHRHRHAGSTGQHPRIGSRCTG